VGRFFVGEILATGSSQDGCCWGDVGNWFKLQRLLLRRCRQQVYVRSVSVGEIWATGSSRESYCLTREMWATGSSWEGFRWRDVGDRFKLGGFSLERCGQQV
jgi:hypothetical protein